MVTLALSAAKAPCGQSVKRTHVRKVPIDETEACDFKAGSHCSDLLFVVLPSAGCLGQSFLVVAGVYCDIYGSFCRLEKYGNLGGNKIMAQELLNPLRLEHDIVADVLYIEGVPYSGNVFRYLAQAGPGGHWVQLQEKDGVMALDLKLNSSPMVRPIWR